MIAKPASPRRNAPAACYWLHSAGAKTIIFHWPRVLWVSSSSTVGKVFGHHCGYPDGSSSGGPDSNPGEKENFWKIPRDATTL